MTTDKTAILKIVRGTLTPVQIDRSCIYWYRKTLFAGDKTVAAPGLGGMPFDGMVVFVDLAPLANWAHPCLYLLVESKTFDVKVVEASLPPGIDQADENFVALLQFGKSPPRGRAAGTR